MTQPAPPLAPRFPRRALLGTGLVGAAALLAACAPTTPAPAPSPTASRARPSGAAQALDELRAGNERFIRTQMQHPDQDGARRVALSGGQEPFAVILTCADSRLPPEIVFDQGLGDLFTIRVAGNIVDSALLGSIEYAVEHLHAPLVVVVGHQNCGAVKAAVDVANGGSLPSDDVASIVTEILPAVQQARADGATDLVDAAVRANITRSRDRILAAHELSDHIASGELTVATGYYSLDDGRVTFS